MLLQYSSTVLWYESYDLQCVLANRNIDWVSHLGNEVCGKSNCSSVQFQFRQFIESLELQLVTNAADVVATAIAGLIAADFLSMPTVRLNKLSAARVSRNLDRAAAQEVLPDIVIFSSCCSSCSSEVRL